MQRGMIISRFSTNTVSRFICEMMQVTAITMEDEYETLYQLSNRIISNDHE